MYEKEENDMSTDELIDKLIEIQGSERSAIAWLMGYAESIEIEQNCVRIAVGTEPREQFLVKLENS